MNDIKKGYNFGTFKGVFTPSILTILGVVMYLRFGWVLGNLGLFLTILVVVISITITFITGLSISAMATNMQVGGGGTYFIISRSLGLEAGSAVSLPLYCAQTLGISFYISGFSESIVAVFPFLSVKLVGVVTLLILMFLSLKSADLAMKAQFVILTLISLSLVSFFWGRNFAGDIVPPAEKIEHLSFWAVFAVFFPAVTGIEAGLSMSGDLKDPGKSLPRGTLLAIGVSFIIYMIIPVYLNSIISEPSILIENSFIMKDVSAVPALVIAGVWGASISSALGAMLGAPRTLQALARDRVVPVFIGRGYGQGNDPRIAIVISFTIALGGILLGDLNLIGPVLSMFFLTAYGLLNLSAAFEGLIASPSWRPTFRFNYSLSFLGGFLCFAVMFMINSGATFIALGISIFIYFLVKRRGMNSSWEDIRYGLFMVILYYVMQKLESSKPDLRTWRPNLLVLSGPPKKRWHLIEISDAIASSRGFITVCTIIPEELETPEKIKSFSSSVKSYLRENHVRAMVSIHGASTILSGAIEMVRFHGFGSVSPNTVVVGETENPESYMDFSELIMQCHKNKKNIAIVRNGELQPSPHKDIKMALFWRGKEKNAGLMLALSQLIKTSGKWSDCKTLLKSIVQDEEEREDRNEVLKEFIDTQNISAEPEVIVGNGSPVFSTMSSNIDEINIVFLGLRTPGEGETTEEYCEYYKDILEKTKNFPTTMMVLASQDIEFNRLFSQKR